MNTSNLKPFNLAEFKSNEETPVVHQDGEAAFIAIPPDGGEQPLICAFFKSQGWLEYQADGTSRKAANGKHYLFFAPRKKVVPLSLEDIKPGMAFRFQAEDIRRFPSEAGSQGLSFASLGFFTYTELQGGWLYSFDCLTWHRCEKEVEV